MNIYALKGHRVTCKTFDAGYAYERTTARRYLNLNSIYTIDYTEVDQLPTSVYLKEFPEIPFNSVFFDDVDEQSSENNPLHPDWSKFNQPIQTKIKTMNVIQIIEKNPNAILPNGAYLGKWSGNIICLNYNDKDYELTTEIGIRGIDINVVVSVKDGIAQFTETRN